MVVDFYFQGLNILEFHAVSFLIKWHLELAKTLRRFRDRKFSGLDMWDQEEVWTNTLTGENVPRD